MVDSPSKLAVGKMEACVGMGRVRGSVEARTLVCSRKAAGKEMNADCSFLEAWTTSETGGPRCLFLTGFFGSGATSPRLTARFNFCAAFFLVVEVGLRRGGIVGQNQRKIMLVNHTVIAKFSLMPMASPTNTHLSANASPVTGKRQARKGQFEYKHGLRHHTHDREKAPYPLAYSKHVLELESIDMRLISHMNGNSVSFVDFSDENWTGDGGVPATPEHSLDLGCGTGAWVIDAAKEWPNCDFVGFDLVDIQIPLKTLPPEYASIAERITWVHGNFLTNKLPFDDDEFDHVHIHAIAQGVPENKWGILFEEINRVLRPGGVVEIMEDGKLLTLTRATAANRFNTDVVFPLLPKWFTAPLRPRPRRSTSVHYPDGTHRGLYPFSDTQSDTTPHDHALLESLYKSVFESRFINLSPTAILPNYFTTYFRHVTLGPVISFFMPPIPPLQPLPPQIITSYVIDPNSDTLDSRTSTVFASPPHEIRPTSLSFSSATSASTNSTAASSHISSLFTGRRKSSSVSTYDSPETATSASNGMPDPPKTPAPFKSFVLDMGMDGEEPAISPDRIPLRNQLSQLNERSLAMHLYRSYQIVLACQEEMWEELKDRIRNRKDELKPFGWDDDEELEELQNRKKFELLVDRYRTDMQTRTALWCSLTGIGWPFPPREPLSKAELIEEERIRAAMIEARTYGDSDDETPSPCRSLRVLKAVMSRKGKGKAKEQPTTTAAAPKRRVQVAASEPSSGPSWDWTSLTDSLVSNVPPIFTKDGSYFFSLVGASVRICAVTTGKVVSTLSIPRPAGYDASSDTLTCAVLNPHNAFQLITGSLAGVLADSVFVTASRPGKKGVVDDNAIVLRVSLKPADAASQSTVQKSSEITPIGKIRFPTGLAFSPAGAWLVATAGHKAYVASTASLRSGFTKYVSPERLTCLAFHPTEDYFATGDEKGNIRLWYCLNDQLPVKPVGVEKKTQTTTLHWHAHAVSSLAFTSNGAYLLSGGEESVLVIWQLHTGKREFLPRIGSPIKTISLCKVASGEEEYLLGLADATYTFVGAASLKISRSYSRIKLDPAAVYSVPYSSKHIPTPLSVHNPTSTLILPSSHPASLQIYSPLSSTVVSELEVSPSNRVSRRDDKPIEPCRVERATISPSGEWMATIDIREGDESTHGECYLKIWRWDRKAGFWILNTRVDRPHGHQIVLNAAFNPAPEGQPPFLVTIGTDCNIKTFRVQTAKSKSGLSEEFWVARSTLSLQNETPIYVSWSPDASLLAITLPNRVALFNPSTNLLRHSVALPEFGPLSAALFVGKAGRYLGVIGPTDFALWDLIEQRVRWQHTPSGFMRTLVSHPRDDTFAIFFSPLTDIRKSRVALFNVGSAQPVKSLTVPFTFRNVIWYPLVSSSFSLVGITHEWKLIVIGNLRPMLLPSAVHSSKDIFGKSAFGELANAAQLSTSASTSRPWTGWEGAGLFEDPAYLMPPLEKLFEPLMNGFLKPRVAEAPAPPPTPAANEDVDMEGEGGTTVAGAATKRFVDAKEMEIMVDLFRAHTLKAKAPVVVGATATPKQNGLVNGQTNGVSRSSHSKPHGVAAPSKVVLTDDSPAASTPSTPVVNGKKRKKSLG
ncbi:S-adenosyl-L-methionine-dependent methyltransferase [Mycena venus]|uniref:S-adenosyl-L-methionine-dependent methyltransferase n=1 Tax=Mycena venus TaxID=2733690 RepID=A0A8H6XTA2_9AGAR|nr:S-adenosyl-L-methionine-dependent methyltransferase [Mycena venus]